MRNVLPFQMKISFETDKKHDVFSVVFRILFSAQLLYAYISGMKYFVVLESGN